MNALLIVDMQDGFINDYTVKCLPRIQELLSSKLFDVIIATRFVNNSCTPVYRNIGWKEMITSGTNLVNSIEAGVNYVINKDTYLSGAELDLIIREHKVDRVVIVGVDTDVCVLMHAGHLFDCGHRVAVDVSGCASTGGARADEAAVTVLRRIVGNSAVIDNHDQLVRWLKK